MKDSDAPRPEADRAQATSKGRASAAQDEDSVWYRISSSGWFQNSTLAVIVVNALWIGVDVEWNHEAKRPPGGRLPLDPAATVVENAFCVYFAAELLIRLLSYARKLQAFGDFWFVFDGFLVLCMVIENWFMALVELVLADAGGEAPLGSLSAFRLLRLLRLTRMARIMRAVPELMTLCKGMVKAARAVYIILMFLMLVMYVFAIVFTSMLTEMRAEHEEEEDDPCADPSAFFYFGSMGSSMMTLFTNGVLGDNLAQTLDAIKAQSLFLFWAFIIFTVLSAMTLLNMLIGVLCEVISTVASEEAEADKVTDFRSCVSRVFKKMDDSEDGKITQDEWEQIKDKKAFRKELVKLGVEEDNMEKRLQQMSDSLFSEGSAGELQRAPGGLSLDEFCSRVQELTPFVPASALDIEILRRQVSTEDKALRSHMQRMEAVLLDALRRAQGAPAPGAQAPREASRGWLRDMPTELLFHVLKSRALPAPVPEHSLAPAHRLW